MPESIGTNNITSISISNLTKVFLSARDLLARRLVKDYHAITDYDLNYIILSSILQVLFIRTGQGYGFAEPGTLALLAESDSISGRLARACSDTGLSPNILFEKGPDCSRPIPVVPDDALREVIRCMDSEKFPVPISTLPIGNLVVVLEQFLGTGVKVAEGYRVKRAGKSAVLYTGSVDVPMQEVVDYMVNVTMRHAIREPPASGETGIRILDPACGAGIFLLTAYQFLVRHRTVHPYRPVLREELLRDLACQSVYGTDIDPEYISAARFILLLSFIEECRLSGCGQVSPDRLREICECLKGTIRCGNALIDKDYFSGLQEHPFNAEERRKVNAFSWQEAFPHVFDAGGFDLVIGAPPPFQPFAVKAREEYFQTHYDVYAKGAGLYGYFIEKGFAVLRPKGSLAFCIPDTFFRTNNARPLRKFLLSKQIEEIVDFGDLSVFRNATTFPCIIRMSNNKPSHEFCVSKVETLDFPSLEGYVKEHWHPIHQNTLTDGGWTLGDKRTENLQKKLQSVGRPLEEYVMGQIFYGIRTRLNEAFVIDERVKKKLIEEDPKSAEIIKPFIVGKDVKRYEVPDNQGNFLIFTRHGVDIKRYPAILKHLKQFKNELLPRPSNRIGEKWYGRKPGAYEWYKVQDSIDYFTEFEKPKIIYPDIAPRGYFTLDINGSYYCGNTVCFLVTDQKFLLGILNSKLITFYYSKITMMIRGEYLRFFTQLIAKLPIYTPDYDNPDDKARHDRMVTLVTEMLELHKYLSHARTDREKRIIEQEIASTDRRIDSLVYGLYGLTADEITVVEEFVPK